MMKAAKDYEKVFRAAANGCTTYIGSTAQQAAQQAAYGFHYTEQMKNHDDRSVFLRGILNSIADVFASIENEQPNGADDE